MGFKTKPPGIKVVQSIDEFNHFLSGLNSVKGVVNKDVDTLIEKLTEKILKYAIPKNTDGGVMVDIRFFPSEINDLLSTVGYSMKVNVVENYYEKLERTDLTMGGK